DGPRGFWVRRPPPPLEYAIPLEHDGMRNAPLLASEQPSLVVSRNGTVTRFGNPPMFERGEAACETWFERRRARSAPHRQNGFGKLARRPSRLQSPGVAGRRRAALRNIRLCRAREGRNTRCARRRRLPAPPPAPDARNGMPAPAGIRNEPRDSRLPDERVAPRRPGRAHRR